MYDYAEGAHPNILKALSDTNLDQQLGYGEDQFCIDASDIIKNIIKAPNAEIHFVSGGTQANLTVISSALKPYESVIAAKTGHIAVHETGAIEFTGHKIIEVETSNGKLTPELIQPVIEEHCDEHMVLPKMVYISNSTELGTIYTKKDLQSLSLYCKKNNLLLFMDGARLGAALVAKSQDFQIEDIKDFVDVFYIGGTKNGAFIGEVIVLINDVLKENFRFSMKQKGALLAKGRIFGIQFSELFKDNLFFDLARHADDMAIRLVKGISDVGYKFLAEPQTNIIFPIFPNKIIKELENDFIFHHWQKMDRDNTCIRLVTSWATEEKYIDSFIAKLGDI